MAEFLKRSDQLSFLLQRINGNRVSGLKPMPTNQNSVEYTIARSTVRLLSGADVSSLTSVGTGFYYQVRHAATNSAKVVIITNKHVVRGASVAQFVLSTAPDLNDLDEYGQPRHRLDHTIYVPLGVNLVEHPDPTVDLCAVDVTGFVDALVRSGQQLRCAILDSSWLVRREDRSLVQDIERVLVIGYPAGEWDSFNNMPITRQGLSATHPLARYQGGLNFLVDVAAFQGSSGSPVFMYETPFYRGTTGLSAGTKVQLLGVVWGVLERTTDGTLRQVQVPAAVQIIPTMQTSMNLAIALHGEQIQVIDNMLMSRIENIDAANANLQTI